MHSEDSVRQHALQCAKNFKTSWVDLGRALYTVWKDKLFRSWGYSTFDAYTSKEINIRKLTALKLLRSYFFLEKEEPQYLQDDYIESADTASIPTYESVNVLRLAKNKKTFDQKDYEDLKKNVFSKGKDVKEIRKDLAALIRRHEELSPEEVLAKKRESQIKRLLSTLKSLKEEMRTSKLLTVKLQKDIEHLIKELERELS